MYYAIVGLSLLAVFTLVQMLLPKRSIFALLALAGGAAGLYGGFAASLTTGLVALAAALAVVPLAVYLSLLLMAPYEPRLEAEAAAPVTAAELAQLQGLSGVALTPVAPAGVALINGQRVNVVAETAPLPPHSALVVARVQANRVVVRSA